MAVVKQERDLHFLIDFLSPDQFITDRVSLLTYSGDAGLDRGMPDGVVFPQTAADVTRIVQRARAHGIPLIARGAGTGLSGGAVAEHGGIIVEFSRMQHVLSFDERGGRVVVQPGVVTMLLEQQVSAKGWYYPPDPSSGRASTLGGNIAENSGGPHCFKYGVTANYVTGLDVVLADGRQVQLGGHAMDYPEFDLTGLVTGSEGTLAMITSATLRLISLPPALKTLIAAFESVEVAGAAVSDIIAHGLIPATMEMMDRDFLRIIEDFTHAGFPTDAGAALIIEVDGYPRSVEPQMEEIVALLQRHHPRHLQVARTEEERARIWYGRKSAAGAIARLAPAYYLVDVTVPRSKLAVTLTEVNRICKDAGLRVIYVFHAGDGNLHPLILIEDKKDHAHIQQVIEAGDRIVKVCIEYDGSITGEHGVGIEKRAHMSLMYSPTELQAMRDIKDVFDPDQMLNPHKILPPDAPAPAALPAAAHPPASPAAPTSAQEAADILRACAAAGQQVRIAGGGSKSAALPPTDVQLSSKELRGVRTYARDDLYVTVGAGTPLKELQAELAADQMWTPLVSPWDDATIGGIVATAFNAPLRSRYGSLRDLVLSATVALPNGHVIRAGRPVVKNVAGYDLPKLFVGSHGTLGFLSDITLKLFPMPRVRTSLLVPVRYDSASTSLAHGLLWGEQLLRLCLVSSALLLCRGSAVAAAAPEAATAPYVLVCTLEGLPEDVEAEHEAIRAMLQAQQPGETAVELLQVDDLAGSDIWAALVRGETAAQPTEQPTGQPTGHPPALIRMGVAPGDFATALSTVMPTLNGAPFVADFASGLLYAQLTGDIPAHLAALRQVAHAAGGYVCAPLLVGHAGYDAWGYHPAGLELMQAIKARWDAAGMLNPGAFLV